MRSGRPVWSPPLAGALALTGVLTGLRLLALFNTPLELYPDEAQYWLWSRELAWGYYSKPPMVAWLIAAGTAVGGDDEPWIRVGATLAHALAPLALYAAGTRFCTPWTGFWAAALYSLMPGVQLSAAVMTTDAPMLLFLSLAVWMYAGLLRSPAHGVRWAAGLGAALGLAVLSKYAALYFIGGLALHAALSRSARQAWTLPRLATTAGALALVIAPNLAWNAAHDFATVNHTAANANWSDGALFNPGEALEFLGSQLGVFGILPCLALAAGLAACAFRPRRVRSEDVALLCLVLPPLAVVTAQAFISRANANWAVAAYAPGSVLLAAWLVRRRAAWTLGGTVVSQGVVAALFLLVSVSAPLATALNLDNGLKRTRGWNALTQAVVAEAGRMAPTAVAVDDRFLFNALAYYGRDFWSRPGAPPLRIWVRNARPQNQAETEAALTAAQSGRVLHVSLTPDYAPEAARDFLSWRALGPVSIRLDSERTRTVQLFEASGYRRAPRDTVTGSPTAP